MPSRRLPAVSAMSTADGVDEVLLRAAVLAGIGRGDGLDALRQRRVAGGQRIVVLEDPSTLLSA